MSINGDDVNTGVKLSSLDEIKCILRSHRERGTDAVLIDISRVSPRPIIEVFVRLIMNSNDDSMSNIFRSIIFY